MRIHILIVAVAVLIYLGVFARVSFSDPIYNHTIQAEAGNLTELLIDSTTDSKRWASYYGNVTGSITLDDADNYTLYSWDELVKPSGEIYATNTTVADWGGVECMNLSAELKSFNCTGENESCLNITEIEDFFGMQSDDPDGVDETFNRTNKITVGSSVLTDCPATNLHVNDSAQNEDWNQTLLTINDTEYIIFATQVEDNKHGYNQQQWDYQLLVGDDGDDGVATTYFIYTEIV